VFGPRIFFEARKIGESTALAPPLALADNASLFGFTARKRRRGGMGNGSSLCDNPASAALTRV
jgi:hypothetical protein